MTISCPRCGFAFETRATTNTRCRRCRYVVRVGYQSARLTAEPAVERPTDDAGGGVLLVVAAAMSLLALVVPAIVRAVQRRRAARIAPGPAS